jgi:GNAT superfamily N-acetyltransferase
MIETPEASRAAPVIVPIRSLGPSHRDRIAAHLVALDGDDRYLRFGYPATDEQIQRYVDGLNFDRDDIFGIYNRKLELIAMAHLAFSEPADHRSCAEFGVSVLKKARGRGYGSRLFERAVIHARNEGVDLLFIHALTENTAMLKIARHGGATLERAGSETEAYLRLPPATLDSRMGEAVEEQVAQTDYRLKQQARSFRDFLAMLQDIRRGVRKGRHKSAG